MSDYSPLSQEQLEVLNDNQKEVFLQLDPKDRKFYADNFSPGSLGKALERKGEIMQSRARMAAFDQKVNENYISNLGDASATTGLTAGDDVKVDLTPEGRVRHRHGDVVREIDSENRDHWTAGDPPVPTPPIVIDHDDSGQPEWLA